MVSFTAVAVTDARAQSALADYFADRARTFPSGPEHYRTVLPDPAHFEAPDGVFLLVTADSPAGRAAEAAVLGCGGIRRIDACHPGAVSLEVKHLWTRPDARGNGVGRALLSELELRARAFGATELVLDTNASLTAAGGLYRSSGFTEIAPYNDNPNATTWFCKPLG